MSLSVRPFKTHNASTKGATLTHIKKGIEAHVNNAYVDFSYGITDAHALHFCYIFDTSMTSTVMVSSDGLAFGK